MVGADVLARQRFTETRRAVQRLDEIQWSIINECEDWKPPTNGVRVGISDPTANKAIYRTVELSAKLEALKREEHDLTAFIGQSLWLIECVRKGLGEKYANLLEARYIDLWSWQAIRDAYDIKRSNGNRLLGIAFDWMDSLGEERLARGVFTM